MSEERQPWEPPPWNEARPETEDDNRLFVLVETYHGHKLYRVREPHGTCIGGYGDTPTQMAAGTHYATVYDPNMRQYASGGYGRNRIVTADRVEDLRGRVLRYRPARYG
jgi:hypothetical protein